MHFPKFLTWISSCIVLLSFSSNSSCSQINPLEKDSNIPWIAEFTMDHNFSPSHPLNEQNFVKLIKFNYDPSNFDYSNTDNWVSDWVSKNALNEDYSCFKDSDLTQALSKEGLLNISTTIDTIITFHPETFEETISVVRNDLDISQIKGLRTKQVIYYEKSSGNFKTNLVAVAPLYPGGISGESFPLFWVKMDEDFPRDFDINAPEINWAVLISTKGTPLDLNSLKEVKNEDGFNFKETIQKQAFELEKPIESMEAYGCNHFLEQMDVENLYHSIDTIITFDATTFEETVEIIENNHNPDDISHYRLVQEWYYDRSKKQLMNHLKALSPVISIKSPKGKHRYYKPLYYIRYDSVN